MIDVVGMDIYFRGHRVAVIQEKGTWATLRQEFTNELLHSEHDQEIDALERTIRELEQTIENHAE